MDDNIRDLIFQAIDQTISEPDFERLQNAIEENVQVVGITTGDVESTVEIHLNVTVHKQYVHLFAMGSLDAMVDSVHG